MENDHQGSTAGSRVRYHKLSPLQKSLRNNENLILAQCIARAKIKRKESIVNQRYSGGNYEHNYEILATEILHECFPHENCESNRELIDEIAEAIKVEYELEMLAGGENEIPDDYLEEEELYPNDDITTDVLCPFCRKYMLEISHFMDDKIYLVCKCSNYLAIGKKSQYLDFQNLQSEFEAIFNRHRCINSGICQDHNLRFIQDNMGLFAYCGVCGFQARIALLS